MYLRVASDYNRHTAAGSGSDVVDASTAVAVRGAAASPVELGRDWRWVLVRPTRRTLDLQVQKAVELDLVGVLDPLLCLHEPSLVSYTFAAGHLEVEVPARSGRALK